jgi:hypothetical protein
MPRKTKTTKKRPQRRKSPEYAGIESMNRTMQATTQMVGNVAIAGMGMALAGSVIGGLK